MRNPEATIRILEEKHRLVADEIVRGIPERDIAANLGISRDTIGVWKRDPLFQAYLGARREELRAARLERMLPVSLKAAEAVEAYLRRLISDAQTTEDPIEGLKASLQALKIVAELESDEQPTRIPPLKLAFSKMKEPGGGVPAVNPDERVPVPLMAAVTSGGDGGTQ